MAEGGGNHENPFSFKKFVKKKDRTSSFSDEDKDHDDTEDIGPLPNMSNQNMKGKTVLIVDTEDDSHAPPVKKSGDENPFSFKKFLSGPSHASGARPKASHTPRTRNNAPDFASDLPDFVQDNFLEDSQIKKEHLTNRYDLDLPDFTPSPAFDQMASEHKPYDNGALPGDLPDIDANGVANGSHGPDDRGDDKHGIVISRSTMPSGMSSLPDFLSDGAINNTELYNGGGAGSDGTIHSRQRGTPDVSSLEVSGDLELESRRLREDNQKLRQELEDTKKLAVKESDRVSELLKRMERQQKKELEETVVMETAVQQVEATLVTTTQRAVRAETQVAKLKQEVKTLQNKISAVQAERYSGGTEDGLAAIRERTKYTSEQLAGAADMGEQAVKQLMTGVDKLRLLSQVLASIDKITDVTDEANCEASSNT